jgi:hypothetical protein
MLRVAAMDYIAVEGRPFYTFQLEMVPTTFFFLFAQQPKVNLGYEKLRSVSLHGESKPTGNWLDSL